MTATVCAIDVDALSKLLQRQADFYSQLAALSDQQPKFIDSIEPDAGEQLLRLVAARQVLVDQLALINQQLDPYRRDWTRIAAQLTPDQRRSIAAIIEQSEALLARIIKQDEADRARLQQARSNIGLEMRKFTGTAHAAAAYRKAPSNPNLFTNQRG